MPKTIRVEAPAKINLTLEILGKRPDGYHDISSVMQAVGLRDTLEFSLAEKLEIALDTPGWDAEISLVSRAVALLKEATGTKKGARISVAKRIPLSSGLGGDSSDAAAALVGLNRLWQLGLSQKELLEMAPRLGSDVAFFLHGGTAVAGGRGEVIESLPDLPHTQILVFMPNVLPPEKKTARLYASLNANHYTDGEMTRRLAESVKGGKALRPEMLFNAFENVAFEVFEGLSTYRDHLLKLGVGNIHLAGSGPALFTFPRDKAGAEELLKQCRKQGIEAWGVGTEGKEITQKGA